MYICCHYCSKASRPCWICSYDKGPLSWLWPSHCQLQILHHLWWWKHQVHCHCHLREWSCGHRFIHHPPKLLSGDIRSPCLCQSHSHTGSREKQWKQQWHSSAVLYVRTTWWVIFPSKYVIQVTLAYFYTWICHTYCLFPYAWMWCVVLRIPLAWLARPSLTNAGGVEKEGQSNKHT